jgi:molecular chaperone HscA
VAALRETAAASSDAAVVEAAVQALARGTEAFAALRMNEGIRKALAGKNLEAI